MSFLDCVQQRKIIAIVRGLNPKYIIRLGHALAEGGITMMEVTYNQKAPESWTDTASAINAAETELGESMLIGAGTVINPEQVRLTYNAGGHYLVTPTVQTEIIRMGKALGMGVFPGAFTPSEILEAWNAGADAVKVFPASNLGPTYIRALHSPLNHIPFLAVGGIHEENASEYIKAGCIGLGVSGHLVNKEWIENGEWTKVTSLARKYVKAVNEA